MIQTSQSMIHRRGILGEKSFIYWSVYLLYNKKKTFRNRITAIGQSSGYSASQLFENVKIG